MMGRKRKRRRAFRKFLSQEGTDSCWTPRKRFENCLKFSSSLKIVTTFSFI